MKLYTHGTGLWTNRSSEYVLDGLYHGRGGFPNLVERYHFDGTGSNLLVMNDDLAPPLPPLHPGEVLREEFMVPLELSAYAVAKACRVPRTRIERIAREETGISGDTAVRLGRAFGIDPRFWANLQARHDLEVAALAIGGALDGVVPFGQGEATQAA